jgi:hypothetical protein
MAKKYLISKMENTTNLKNAAVANALKSDSASTTERKIIKTKTPSNLYSFLVVRWNEVRLPERKFSGKRINKKVV